MVAVLFEIPFWPLYVLTEAFDGTRTVSSFSNPQTSQDAHKITLLLGIQIRWNGHKGMLVGYPDAFCTDVLHMGENWIAVRPSMKKYDGRLTSLEINAVSHPAGSARLNKMYILLLLTAGIPAAVRIILLYSIINADSDSLAAQTIHELLNEQLEKLDLFMTDRDKAIEILEGTDSAQLDADGEGFNQECKPPHLLLRHHF